MRRREKKLTKTVKSKKNANLRNCNPKARLNGVESKIKKLSADFFCESSVDEYKGKKDVHGFRSHI